MPFSGGVARPTFRAAPLLLLLQSALVAPMSITPLTGRTRSFDVTFRHSRVCYHGVGQLCVVGLSVVSWG